MTAGQWPDWRGETIVIVGTGPSAASADLSLLRGRARIIAIKSSWKLVPFADALYGVDRGWWLAQQGAPGFRGLKFTPSPTAARLYKLTQVTLRPVETIMVDTVGVIGCGLRSGGGYSGFQAINLAVQFGARRIVLVGFDMTLARGAHWCPQEQGVSRPDAIRTETWRRSLDGCAAVFERLGIEVLNATPHSALTAYPRVSIEEAL